MERLWAPWRISYIAAKKRSRCILCAAKKRSQDYVVLESSLSFALLNAFPYNNGHLMVCPKRHTADISSLTKQEITDLFIVFKQAKKLLEQVLKPHGYNIGMNLGAAAGAGITGHLHIHIVPRWKGDVNFMPVVGNTKVISQSLEELYRCLLKAKNNA